MTPQENCIKYAQHEIKEAQALMKLYPQEVKALTTVINGWTAVIERMKQQLQEQSTCSYGNTKH